MMLAKSDNVIIATLHFISMVWAARTFFPGMALSSQAEGSVAWWRYYRITVYVVYTAVVARPGHSAPRARTLARPARSPPGPRPARMLA